MSRLVAIIACSILAAACGLPAEQRGQVEVKDYIAQNLDALVADATAMCNAAPAAKATGWDPMADRTAIEAMKTAWKKVRPDYERVEGAIAVLFPELDASTDERYDGFIEAEADADLFDDQGVTGVHAIERIVWSDSIPAHVKTFEESLGARYIVARFPQNQTEATNFKDKLCKKLVTDVTAMRDEFKPLALDNAAAFRGVIGSLAEQIEKVDHAATGSEESRYAQFTLADMRANYDGAKKTYDAFRPWILEKGGKADDEIVLAGFKRISDEYAKHTGDSIPEVPASWSSANPSPADLATPFGQVWTTLKKETDESDMKSLTSAMLRTADLLGIPQLPAN